MRIPVLYAVTDPVTALSFLPGQLAFLRAEGFDPHLACGRTPELDSFAETEGVTLHDVPLSRSWLGKQDILALLRARRVLRSVRPAVLNYSTPKAALIWAVASWFSRPPLVVFLLRGLRLEGERSWRPGFMLLWLMEVLAARSAHITVCVSEGLRQRALELHLMAPNRGLVLGAGSSNGVDTVRFTPVTVAERSAARRLMGIASSALVVGYIGRFAKDKGLEDLLAAVDRRARAGDHIRCVLVGAPEPDFDVMSSLASWPHAAAVTLVRPATKHVEEVYSAFDLFVLPSHREGLSNALLEAQARALPCITTDATGCVDAIAPGESGLVVPTGDVDALAEALRRFAEPGGREIGHAMGALGRRRVESLFQPTRVWADYADLYRRNLAVGGNGSLNIETEV